MPFVLYPDLPKDGVPRATNNGETETEFLEPLRSRAQESMVILNRPKWRPNTQVCHEATAYAKEKGLESQFIHAAAEAYWVRNENLSEMATIARLADYCGLNGAELLQLLESGLYSNLILRQSAEARGIGVFGTPTYGIGDELIFGDLNYDTLKTTLKKARIIP